MSQENVANANAFYIRARPVDNQHKFYFHVTSEGKINKIVGSMKYKAGGVNNISIVMIKLCRLFVMPFITHTVNSCLLQNYFPMQWNASIVNPLHKTKKNERVDLRPVSILPCLSKVVEKVSAS